MIEYGEIFRKTHIRSIIEGDTTTKGKQTIKVFLKIDKSGNVFGVRSRAPQQLLELEKEATRVINMLPKMKPGRQRGKAIIVSLIIPFTFEF